MGNRNPIPALILTAVHGPQVQDPAVASALQDVELHAKTVSPRIWTIGTPIYAPNGPPPKPPSDAFVEQPGTQSVSFTGGLGLLTLPNPFPNGWLSLQLTSQNSFFLNYILSGTLTLGTISIVESTSVTASLGVDYRAIGW
jgi:hypothetical protein